MDKLSNDSISVPEVHCALRHTFKAGFYDTTFLLQVEKGIELLDVVID